MFNEEDRKVFGAMHQELQKDMSNMNLQTTPQSSWYTNIFKLWLSFGIIGAVLGIGFWVTVGWVAFHFISKWW